jgi:type I restriction enzyme M protein
MFLLNASREFEKGDPKNYITEEGITRIAETFKAWREEDKFTHIVSRDEIVKNDYNISPSRYIHTGDAEDYRPIEEIWFELQEAEEESRLVDNQLKQIMALLAE